MSGYIQYIINPTKQPDIPGCIYLRTVTGEVRSIGPLTPVLRYISFWITIDTPEHSRPWLRKCQQATTLFNHTTVIGTNFSADPGKWVCG